MPQYTYRCKNCSHEFSIEQRMSDSSLTDCPECKGELRKVISRVSGVVFKGSGFYVTDNRNGKKKSGSGGSNGSSSESAKSSESSSEKKESSESKKSESSSGKSESKTEAAT